MAATRAKSKALKTKYLPITEDSTTTDTNRDFSFHTMDLTPGSDISAQAEVDEDCDGPVVFVCGKCSLPVGDSLSWAGSEDSQSQIHLKRVTDNVLVGKESHVYEPSKRSRCLIVDLTCRGCHSLLGMVYVSTPKSLDFKRFAFCFNVADIESYVLGSANQMVAAEGPKEQPVTLEYRGIVEQQLTEIKTLVVSMAQRLEEIEAGLQEGGDEP
ncbi:protein Mis18-alpha [Myripristis murdjan]|uniref:Protein Mis18-alpha n=1 Tax=Myripristis murdjan TaxID=586833 RepID=A0A667YZA4_9TELE|nr:protein Mis18-alpha [Myripristis murdjan]